MYIIKTVIINNTKSSNHSDVTKIQIKKYQISKNIYVSQIIMSIYFTLLLPESKYSLFYLGESNQNIKGYYYFTNEQIQNCNLIFEKIHVDMVNVYPIDWISIQFLKINIIIDTKILVLKFGNIIIFQLNRSIVVINNFMKNISKSNNFKKCC